MIQSDKEHYRFENYGYPERWASYYHQLKEIMVLRAGTLLQIGVGDGVVPEYLKKHSDIACRTLDINEELKPDVVGSIDNMPLPDASFDVVCCFEVLEHLPFERFEPSLRELVRVSKGHVLLSIPHFGPPVKFLVKIPLFPEFRFMWKIPYRPEHQKRGEHEWEMGKRGYTPTRIRESLEKHFVIERDYVPFDAPYHHFFILKKSA